jgi:uncharacterized protein YndB with AHSA1/START domain
MQNASIALAETTIAAPRAKVWRALVTPAAIKTYMFGTDVTTDWKLGSEIFWEGEWQGKHYRDKGEILEIEPEHVLQYSHFSPLSGLPDSPENYHTVTIRLTEEGSGTHVSLSQDNNASEDARRHSEQNWRQVLAGLKSYAES